MARRCDGPTIVSTDVMAHVEQASGWHRDVCLRLEHEGDEIASVEGLPGSSIITLDASEGKKLGIALLDWAEAVEDA